MKEAFKLDLIQASSVKLGGDWHTPSDGVVNVHGGIGHKHVRLTRNFGSRSMRGVWRAKQPGDII